MPCQDHKPPIDYETAQSAGPARSADDYETPQGARSKGNGVLKTVLPNGLTVVLKENHNAPVATFWVWYRVGSGRERTGITGISHWVEHMLFKGTHEVPRPHRRSSSLARRRPVERLHVARLHHLFRNAARREDRSGVGAGSRSDGERPLPPARCCLRAHRHHQREARRRKQSAPIAGRRSAGRRVPRARLRPRNDRPSVRSADDDARRSLHALSHLLCAQQCGRGGRRRIQCARTC